MQTNSVIAKEAMTLSSDLDVVSIASAINIPEINITVLISLSFMG